MFLSSAQPRLSLMIKRFSFLGAIGLPGNTDFRFSARVQRSCPRWLVTGPRPHFTSNLWHLISSADNMWNTPRRKTVEVFLRLLCSFWVSTCEDHRLELGQSELQDNPNEVDSSMDEVGNRHDRLVPAYGTQKSHGFISRWWTDAHNDRKERVEEW